MDGAGALPPRTPGADAFTRLVYLQRRGGPVGRAASVLLRARGTYVPASTLQGERLRLLHTGHGVVVDDRTVLEDDVWIFHNVTIGRGKPWVPRSRESGRVVVRPGVILCAGAVVVVPAEGELVIERGSVVAANAVLTCSTGPWEIWGGSPAIRIGQREEGLGPGGLPPTAQAAS